ncbi:DUF4365 domain-containing protein [Paenibacillus sp. DMB5]|uniref:DUF4365 domain-containing protein n=1 Tax=Paenibacillus sp. DMB5 TaxID=1780103 RepID=UPI00076D7D01|nr:DUF4365 domain-containing protein [Paenibacillus sp. DMB5]KUP23095.1 hypothetical protein AWJ19_22725 [Paenibacillus sp. DMB5]
MEPQLPKVHENTKKGNVAVALLESVLSRFSIVNTIPVEKDIGIDLHVELLNGSTPNGLCFNGQCKGKDEVEIDEQTIIIPIKISTINYWLLHKEPTFLFVVDIDGLSVFWCYPYEQISERLGELQQQKTVNIHVDKKSVFSLAIKEVPVEIVEVIRNYDYKLFENLSHSVSHTVLENAGKQQGTLKEKLMAFKDSANRLKENSSEIINRQRDQFVLDETKVVLEKFRFVFLWLDAESTFVYPYTKGKSISEADGFIKDSTIKTFITTVNENIRQYENGSNDENFNALIVKLEELNKLNENLAFFLREVLYDMNPYADFEFLVSDYK